MPSYKLYESDCDVKRIVMERIELLEAVNHASHNWKTVVDTRSCDGSSFNNYSEGGVFSLRFWSMYLAIALKHFVANVTGDMRTQWSWKRCLMYAIRAMNDVGIEFYSSFATLTHWHRKLAWNRNFFYSAPEPKTAYPPFFRYNPDTMEAFKKHGVANLKDLSVELMYAHNNLIPRLMVKRCHENACFFDDDGGNQNDGVVGAITMDKIVTPTTRSKNLAINCGCNYVTNDGVAMVEYHIDTSICTFFEEQPCHLPLGGNLSVRRPIGTSVAMFMGQDEAILNSFYSIQRCGSVQVANGRYSRRMKELEP